MRWKWKLGQLAGINIYLHWTLALLLVSVGLSWSGYGTEGVALGLASTVSVLALVTLHELGHALAARQFGVGTRDITLLPIGGLARLERMPSHPGQELLVAAAGPAVNFALAALISLFGWLPLPWWGAFLAAYMIKANLVLGLFNLLPAFPMDGGRILRAGLALQGRSLSESTDLAVRVSRLASGLLGLYGVVTGQLWLLVLALYVWLAASFELAQVRTGLGGFFGGIDSSAPGWGVRFARRPTVYVTTRR